MKATQQGQKNEEVSEFSDGDVSGIGEQQPTSNKKSKRTSLDQLSKAIRNSSLLFIIATIALVAGSMFLMNRQNALAEIVKLHNDVDAFEVNVLQMRQHEKDFQLSQQQTHVLKHDKEHEKALEALKSISSNAMLLPEDNIKISRLNNALSVYKKQFDGAAETLEKRGFDDVSGTRKVLREIALKLNKSVEGSVFESPVVNLRGISKDFIILERPEFLDTFKQASLDLTEMVQNSGLSVTQKNELLDTVSKHRDAFTEYSKFTLDAKNNFEDTTVAAHASLYTLPKFREKLDNREKNIFNQVFWILVATLLVLVGIFLLVLYQLRRAQAGANLTLEEREVAQQKAEQENEQLNDSIINILQSVHQLSQRDLTVKAPVTEDVVGTVSDSINFLTDETSRVLKDVTNVAGQVKDSSEKVRSQAGMVSHTAEQERESVSNMVDSLYEATQSMERVAQLAQESNKATIEATEVTENALNTVNNTVKGMESIRETIAETEKRIKRLGERSQEISGIVNLINTISERTHVLALNASMQAAVAGEAGRGFAVVAEEVQRLAESSRNATQQIASLVGNIQIETNETINTVNNTISQVVEGSSQAQKAGEQMRHTQQITEKLVNQIRLIAEASEQQKSMSSELLEAVQHIGASTEQTAQQIESQNQETLNLQQAAQRLVESVSVFKLPA